MNVLFLCFSNSRAMLRAQQPPLKERILRSKSQSPSCVSLHIQNRPHEYKSWSIDHLQQAYDAVTKRGLSVRRASEEYRVPRSTLHDRISGKVQFGARSGPPAYLTQQEENELEDFICNCAKIGYARTRLQVIALVQHVTKEKGLNVTVPGGVI